MSKSTWRDKLKYATELRHIYAIAIQHGKGTIVNDLRKQTLDNLSKRSVEVSQALLPKRL